VQQEVGQMCVPQPLEVYWKQNRSALTEHIEIAVATWKAADPTQNCDTLGIRWKTTIDALAEETDKVRLHIQAIIQEAWDKVARIKEELILDVVRTPEQYQV
jgi:hypothetical protein